MFWIVSANRLRTLFISPTYERVYGRSLEEVNRDPRLFIEALHPEDRARVAASLDDGGRPFEHEYRIVRPDEQIRWIRDRGQPVRDDTGAIVYFVGVAQDVTDRKLLETELHHLMETLALTSQATNDGIWDWNIKANSAWWSDAMYTRFGFDRSEPPRYEAWVEHIHPDDRERVITSLNHTLELSMLRSTSGLPGKAAGHAHDIDGAPDRAAALTRQLLVFSRREAMRRRPLDLNTKLMDLARMLRRTIGEDIALHLDLAPGTIPIAADPGMIDQVLLNLVLNARDAMHGGGRLAISTTLERGEACITVQDSGAGIPADDLPRIFEPFFTTKEPGHGTGLGLATVHGIVEQHGGRIEVDSTPGRGSTFRVFLPTSDGAASTDAAPPSTSTHGRETILLVEDEAIVRRSLRQVIEQAGYTVVEAESGPVALSRQLEAGARHEILHKPVPADQLLGRIRASLDRA